MSKALDNAVNIIGAALILGLLLRWGPQAAQLIATVSSSVSSLYETVSLQRVVAPTER